MAGWNSLPPELKLHCIKNMNFLSKSRLRGLARTERALVDSVPLSFTAVSINLVPRSLHFEVTFKEGEKDEDYFWAEWFDPNMQEGINILSDNMDQFEMMTKVLQRVLSAEIEHLTLTTHGDSRGDKDQKLVTELIAQLPLLKVQKFKFQLYRKKTVGLAILKHCSLEHLTDVELFQNYVADKELTREFLRLPQVVKARKLVVADLGARHVKGIIKYAIKKWPVDGSPIGKQLRTVLSNNDAIKILVKQIRNKKIRHDYEKGAGLYETADPSKHFWIRTSESPCFLQMFLVDANSEEVPIFDTYDDRLDHCDLFDYELAYSSSYNDESDY